MISLRYKFLALIVAVVCASVLVQLVTAVRLFNEDKKPFVYEGIGSLVDGLAEDVQTQVTSAGRTMTLFAAAYNQAYQTAEARSRALDAVAHVDDDVVDLALYPWPRDTKAIAAPLARVSKPAFFEPYHLPSEPQAAVLAAHPLNFAPLTAERLFVENASLEQGVMLLRICLRIEVDGGKSDRAPPSAARGAAAAAAKAERQVVVATVRQDRRARLFSRAEIFTSFLMDRYGHFLVHPVATKVLSSQVLQPAEWTDAIRQMSGSTTVLELKDSHGDSHIVAAARVAAGDLFAVAEIPRAKAFLASRQLGIRSLYFALEIIFVSVVLSLIFTRGMTVSLRRLYEATRQVAKGVFDVELAVRSRDEVGALSQSFNRMTGEIRRLLLETADKARMEKELETAQMVQENFFPDSEVRFGKIEVAAYFKSASECGGDWWGAIPMGDRLMILIGDATGHGVPAALITAATYSCAVTIAEIAKQGQTLSPKRVAEVLNSAVLSAGRGKIKMTFFIAEVDQHTGDMTYVNASHETPLIWTPAVEGGEKATVSTLTTPPDSCLGAAQESSFTEHHYKVTPNQIVLWFTDGIVEARSEDGKEFGEGRLKRTVAKLGTEALPELRATLAARVLEFCGQRPLDDDLTMELLRRSPSA